MNPTFALAELYVLPKVPQIMINDGVMSHVPSTLCRSKALADRINKSRPNNGGTNDQPGSSVQVIPAHQPLPLREPKRWMGRMLLADFDPNLQLFSR